MKTEINIYCDESCHLMHKPGKATVLGALWCPKTKRHEAFKRIREIKAEYGFKPEFEVKWNKVSNTLAENAEIAREQLTISLLH